MRPVFFRSLSDSGIRDVLDRTSLFLLGAPGSGKDAQMERLTSMLPLTPFSVGNLLDQAYSDGSHWAHQIAVTTRETIAAGHLAPDDMINQLVRDGIERLARERDKKPGTEFRRFAVSGAARRIRQYEYLSNSMVLGAGLMPPIWIVLNMHGDTEIAAKRIASDPTRANRSDNDKVKARMETFEVETLPVVKWIRQFDRDSLVEVDARSSFVEVAAQLDEKLLLVCNKYADRDLRALHNRNKMQIAG